MSFPYQAGTWTPLTATEHAAAILAAINAELAAEGIADSQGNQMVLAPIATNGVWIQCLAVGALRAADDQALLAASQMFSITECSDAQVLSVLPIVGTALIPGAFSLAVLQVSAGTTPATVPAGSVVPYGNICDFLTETAISIPANSTVNVLCEASVIGPITAPIGALTAFSPAVPNVSTVNNPTATIPGRLPETVSAIRQRIQTGNVFQQSLGGTIVALQGIQGLASAQCYLNVSPTANLALTGVSVPPLSAYIVVSGVDLTGVAIAAAYAQRMLVQTFSVGPAFSYTRTDLTFSASASTVTTAAGNFLLAGFALGMGVTFSGSTYNNVTGNITALSATVMTLGNCSITNESDANSITLAYGTYQRNDVSFAAGNVVNTAAGNFLAAGFSAGQWVQITDGNAGALNNGVLAEVSLVTAGSMTLSNAVPQPIQAESAAGTVTLVTKNVQPYVTGSGQNIPIQFDVAPVQQCYVTVYYDLASISSATFAALIQATVAALPWAIGQPITSAAVLQGLAGFPYARITGAQVSLASSGGLHNEVLPNANAQPQVVAANVTVAAG